MKYLSSMQAAAKFSCEKRKQTRRRHISYSIYIYFNTLASRITQKLFSSSFMSCVASFNMASNTIQFFSRVRFENFSFTEMCGACKYS